MSFCGKCGYKIEEGDNFCINCGQPVDKNIISRDDVEYKFNNVQKNVVISQFSIHLKETVKIFWRMLTKPGEIAGKFIKQGSKEVLIILTTFIVLLQGLFGMWRISQVYSQIFRGTENIMVKFITGVSKITGENLRKQDILEIQNHLSEIKGLIQVPYSKVFFQSIVLSLISMGTIILCVYIILNFLYKANIHILKLIKTVVISYTPIIYGEFFGIILGYINYNLGITLFIISVLISIGCLYQSTRELLLKEGEGAIFSVSTSIGILIIIIYVLGCKFLQNDFLRILDVLRGLLITL